MAKGIDWAKEFLAQRAKRRKREAALREMTNAYNEVLPYRGRYWQIARSLSCEAKSPTLENRIHQLLKAEADLHTLEQHLVGDKENTMIGYLVLRMPVGFVLENGGGFWEVRSSRPGLDGTLGYGKKNTPLEALQVAIAKQNVIG